MSNTDYQKKNKNDSQESIESRKLNYMLQKPMFAYVRINLSIMILR